MNKETRIAIVKEDILNNIQLLMSIHDLKIEDSIQILKEIIDLLSKK